MKNKAIALFSGGLDSILAVKVIEDAGANVIGLTFSTPFFGTKQAEIVAKKIGLNLIIRDIFKEHIGIVKKPRFGYGKNMNPCIDCHALMVRIAREMLDEVNAHFIITGEVLNERPKSQSKRGLFTVAKHSNAKDILLRPLSAKLLPITLPEREGWIDREKLLGISGRSRKPQMELAKKYGISEYPTPAGGCLLTDINFSNRLKRLLKTDGYQDRRIIELLKYGRHFWKDDFHIIIGRNNEENERILSYKRDMDIVIRVYNKPSPITLVINGEKASMDLLKEVAGVTLRYSKFRHNLNEQLLIGEQIVIIERAIFNNNWERM